eukprot:gene6192-2810_t
MPVRQLPNFLTALHYASALPPPDALAPFLQIFDSFRSLCQLNAAPPVSCSQREGEASPNEVQLNLDLQHVAKLVGEDLEIHTLDVKQQAPGPKWTLRQWCLYWRDRKAAVLHSPATGLPHAAHKREGGHAEPRGVTPSLSLADPENQHGAQGSAAAAAVGSGASVGPSDTEDEADSAFVHQGAVDQFVEKSAPRKGIRESSKGRFLALLCLGIDSTPLATKELSPPASLAAVNMLSAAAWGAGGTGWKEVARQFPPRHYLSVVPARSADGFRLNAGGATAWLMVKHGSVVFFLLPPTHHNLQLYCSWITSGAREAGMDLIGECDGAIRVELMSSEIEDLLHVKPSQRFPSFHHVMWQATIHYAKLLRTATALPKLSLQRQGAPDLTRAVTASLNKGCARQSDHMKLEKHESAGWCADETAAWALPAGTTAPTHSDSGRIKIGSSAKKRRRGSSPGLHESSRRRQYMQYRFPNLGVMPPPSTQPKMSGDTSSRGNVHGDATARGGLVQGGSGPPSAYQEAGGYYQEEGYDPLEGGERWESYHPGMLVIADQMTDTKANLREAVIAGGIGEELATAAGATLVLPCGYPSVYPSPPQWLPQSSMLAEVSNETATLGSNHEGQGQASGGLRGGVLGEVSELSGVSPELQTGRQRQGQASGALLDGGVGEVSVLSGMSPEIQTGRQLGLRRRRRRQGGEVQQSRLNWEHLDAQMHASVAGDEYMASHIHNAQMHGSAAGDEDLASHLQDVQAGSVAGDEYMASHLYDLQAASAAGGEYLASHMHDVQAASVAGNEYMASHMHDVQAASVAGDDYDVSQLHESNSGSESSDRTSSASLSHVRDKAHQSPAYLRGAGGRAQRSQGNLQGEDYMGLLSAGEPWGRRLVVSFEAGILVDPLDTQAEAQGAGSGSGRVQGPAGSGSGRAQVQGAGSGAERVQRHAESGSGRVQGRVGSGSGRVQGPAGSGSGRAQGAGSGAERVQRHAETGSGRVQGRVGSGSGRVQGHTGPGAERSPFYSDFPRLRLKQSNTVAESKRTLAPASAFNGLHQLAGHSPEVGAGVSGQPPLREGAPRPSRRIIMTLKHVNAGGSSHGLRHTDGCSSHEQKHVNGGGSSHEQKRAEDGSNHGLRHADGCSSHERKHGDGYASSPRGHQWGHSSEASRPRKIKLRTPWYPKPGGVSEEEDASIQGGSHDPALQGGLIDSDPAVQGGSPDSAVQGGLSQLLEGSLVPTALRGGLPQLLEGSLVPTALRGGLPQLLEGSHVPTAQGVTQEAEFIPQTDGPADEWSSDDGGRLMPRLVLKADRSGEEGCSSDAGPPLIPQRIPGLHRAGDEGCSSDAGPLLMPRLIPQLDGAKDEWCSDDGGRLMPRLVLKADRSGEEGCSSDAGPPLIPQRIPRLHGAGDEGCSRPQLYRTGNAFSRWFIPQIDGTGDEESSDDRGVVVSEALPFSPAISWHPRALESGPSPGLLDPGHLDGASKLALASASACDDEGMVVSEALPCSPAISCPTRDDAPVPALGLLDLANPGHLDRAPELVLASASASAWDDGGVVVSEALPYSPTISWPTRAHAHGPSLGLLDLSNPGHLDGASKLVLASASASGCDDGGVVVPEALPQCAAYKPSPGLLELSNHIGHIGGASRLAPASSSADTSAEALPHVPKYSQSPGLLELPNRIGHIGGASRLAPASSSADASAEALLHVPKYSQSPGLLELPNHIGHIGGASGLAPASSSADASAEALLHVPKYSQSPGLLELPNHMGHIDGASKLAPASSSADASAEALQHGPAYKPSPGLFELSNRGYIDGASKPAPASSSASVSADATTGSLLCALTRPSAGSGAGSGAGALAFASADAGASAGAGSPAVEHSPISSCVHGCLSRLTVHSSMQPRLLREPAPSTPTTQSHPTSPRTMPPQKSQHCQEPARPKDDTDGLPTPVDATARMVADPTAAETTTPQQPVARSPRSSPLGPGGSAPLGNGPPFGVKPLVLLSSMALEPRGGLHTIMLSPGTGTAGPASGRSATGSCVNEKDTLLMPPPSPPLGPPTSSLSRLPHNSRNQEQPPATPAPEPIEVHAQPAAVPLEVGSLAHSVAVQSSTMGGAGGVEVGGRSAASMLSETAGCTGGGTGCSTYSVVPSGGVYLEVPTPSEGAPGSPEVAAMGIEHAASAVGVVESAVGVLKPASARVAECPAKQPLSRLSTPKDSTRGQSTGDELSPTAKGEGGLDHADGPGARGGRDLVPGGSKPPLAGGGAAVPGSEEDDPQVDGPKFPMAPGSTPDGQAPPVPSPLEGDQAAEVKHVRRVLIKTSTALPVRVHAAETFRSCGTENTSETHPSTNRVILKMSAAAGTPEEQPPTPATTAASEQPQTLLAHNHALTEAAEHTTAKEGSPRSTKLPHQVLFHEEEQPAQPPVQPPFPSRTKPFVEQAPPSTPLPAVTPATLLELATSQAARLSAWELAGLALLVPMLRQGLSQANFRFMDEIPFTLKDPAFLLDQIEEAICRFQDEHKSLQVVDQAFLAAFPFMSPGDETHMELEGLCLPMALLTSDCLPQLSVLPYNELPPMWQLFPGVADAGQAWPPASLRGVSPEPGSGVAGAQLSGLLPSGMDGGEGDGDGEADDRMEETGESMPQDALQAAHVGAEGLGFRMTGSMGTSGPGLGDVSDMGRSGKRGTAASFEGARMGRILTDEVGKAGSQQRLRDSTRSCYERKQALDSVTGCKFTTKTASRVTASPPMFV